MSIDNVQGSIFLKRALSRKRHVIIWLTVLGLALGTASYFLTPRTYTSTATVFLNQLVGNPFSPTTPSSRTEQLAALTTESGVVLTDEVIAAAIGTAGLEDATPQSFRQSTEATIPSNSQVMEVSVTASNARDAQRSAQALTQSFLDFRTSRAQQVMDAQGQLLASREESLTALLANANKAYDAARQAKTAPASLIDLDQQVRLYAQELATVKVERTTNANSSLDPGSIIGPASEPRSPDGISGTLTALLIVVLGFLGGLMLALVAEHADSRIRDRSDLERHGAPRALGELSGPVSRGQLKEVALERYLSLVPVLNKQVSLPGSLALVGRGHDEEMHAMAIGLSVAFALRGKRVCVVSTAGISRNGKSRPGLSDVLAREVSWTDAIQTTHYSKGSVAVLPAGTQEEKLSLLAQPVVIAELTRELQASCDLVMYVVCETGTVLAATVASCMDQTILAAPAGRIKAQELLAAERYLSERGAAVPGCLLYASQWVLASEKELVEGFQSRSRELEREPARERTTSVG